MEYNECKTSGFLSHFIDAFWAYKNDGNRAEYTILPDGCFDLIVTTVGENKSIILTGIWTKPVNVVIEPNTQLLSIRFKLLASEYIFKREIKNILNTSTTLPGDFWEIDQLKLDDFNGTVSMLLHRLDLAIKHLKKIDDRKLSLFELAYSDNYSSVFELSQKIHWSSRQINRYFDSQYGFPLKTFLNIIRTNSSYKSIANGELYPAQSYFDQSHFIKAIRKYTGVSPRELAKNENDRFLQLRRRS